MDTFNVTSIFMYSVEAWLLTKMRGLKLTGDKEGIILIHEI
jgi:hypothetical protein